MSVAVQFDVTVRVALDEPLPVPVLLDVTVRVALDEPLPVPVLLDVAVRVALDELLPVSEDERVLVALLVPEVVLELVAVALKKAVPV